MKDFFKQWILVFGLVVISAIIVPAFINNQWTIASFVIKLLIATFTVCLLNLGLNKLTIELAIVKHLVRLGIILAVVYVYGWIWKWYEPFYFWIVLVMVVPVYIIYYLIETAKVDRDVDLINRQIQSRKEKSGEKKHGH